MSLTEISSIFILKAKCQKNVHVILLGSHNTYLNFFETAFPAAEMGAQSVGPEETLDTHTPVSPVGIF